MIERRACMGGNTEPCRMADFGHGQKCLSCGTRVRDDQVDSKFFGFVAGCTKATTATSADLPASS